ncbi:helix-turn-helix transcriptional regulator [Paenibacillus sp. GCM10027629]|uniref:helix-turn-helix transcriptional regulator n=1 Tax=Paenibacillus sp. GCM10027629 TaxID=3273414 RepID=UPI003639133F
MGKSPIVYANRVKINTAKLMLIQTNDTIRQISSTLGFDNVTYFHRLFKNIEGVTPKQYRERNKM